MKDCCSEHKNHKHESSHKSNEPNWKNIITWGAIGILLVVVLYTVLSQGSTQTAVPAAQAGAKAASSYGGMVGGC